MNIINKIPKVIHYCWFGKKPLPDSAKKCIASWEKFFPDYKIKEWNEQNFNINCCNYVREAYDAGKWAFVSDYARFWILYHEGGLYFDTDVEIIKDMEPIINRGAFMGCETIDKCAPGLGLGVNPGLGLYKEILDYYENIHFMSDLNHPETVVDHTTKILREYGWKGNGEVEQVAGITIYPPDYLCPMDYRTGKIRITENTYSIHWYTASWQSKYSRVKTKIQHLLGNQITNRIIDIKKRVKRHI